MFTITINTENAAFHEDEGTSTSEEIARILREAAQTIERGEMGEFLTLRDINGNAVGLASAHD